MDIFTPDFKVSENSPSATEDPIDIQGDNWETYYPGVDGNGTFNNPYVIADLIIDAQGVYGISISNSQSYGRIENCTIYNSHTGILLGGANNCTLVDNIVLDAISAGFNLNQLKNCTAIGNTVNYATYGFYFHTVSNSTLINNTVSGGVKDGILLHYSPNCTLTGNSVLNSANGIQLFRSPFCKLTENSGRNNVDAGISCFISENCTLIGNSAANNEGWGLNIFYSSNCTLIDNNINENDKSGILLWNSSDCLVVGNNAIDNTDSGIEIKYSLNCNLTNNNLSYNGDGISIDDESENNTIYENELIKNFWWAILDNGINNDIHDNLIINVLTFSFTASKTTIEIDEEIDFICNSTDGYTPLSYSWDFGDGSTSTVENPSHSYSTGGNYIVTLTVTESDNESSSDSIIIEVIPYDTPRISGYPIGILVSSIVLVANCIKSRKR